MPYKSSQQQSGFNRITDHETTVRRGLRFWEIDRFFKCPVVGMCISLPEQKQLVRKAGISIKKKGPFELHEALVANSESENRLSRRVDNLLHRKFGKQTARWLACDPAQFMAEYHAAFDCGEYAEFVWATAVNPDLPLECKRKVFGDIHMAMHHNAHQSGKAKQKEALRQKEISDLRSKLKEAQGNRRVWQKKNARLKQERSDLRAAIVEMEKRHEKAKAETAGPDDRNRVGGRDRKYRILKQALERALHEWRHQVADLREKNRQLSAELERQLALNRRFEAEARGIIGEFAALDRCDATCPAFDLCKKRILIVGGITRMASLYRELIESRGGIFEYHDGYMKKGARGLESSLKRADLVLCPVNCNSHAACSIVKNLAKKHRKTVHMLANFSMSTVSQVIRGPHTGRGTLN